MKPIDADRILEILNIMKDAGSYPKEVEFASFVVRDAPEVDAVPVVRCKDCKFYTSMIPREKIGICDLNVHHMGDDGFCSCGERKNETD